MVRFINIIHRYNDMKSCKHLFSLFTFRYLVEFADKGVAFTKPLTLPRKMNEQIAVMGVPALEEGKIEVGFLIYYFLWSVQWKTASVMIPFCDFLGVP